jgi:hypothetical protein
VPDWQIANARLTFFVAPDFVEPPLLWRECVGDDSETSSLQRATATKTETGPLAEARLTLQVQPMRVDWIHAPMGIANEQGLPPFLGTFPGAADPLLQLGRRWATSVSFPDTPRIALGLTLMSRTEDRASGYRELADFVPVPTDPNVADFSCQINIPRSSCVDVADLKVNRLSKWSVGLSRLFAITPTGLSPIPMRGPDLCYLSLDLDINTLLSSEGLLPRHKVPAIIDDLVEGAKEVVRGLDVRWTNNSLPRQLPEH